MPQRDIGSRLAALTKTIRGQISLALLFMTAIVGLIGVNASYRIQHGGALVTETYDGSLMAINYARAASADFALMQVTALRRAQALDAASRSVLDGQLAELKDSLAEDIEIAMARSQSARAVQAAVRVKEAIEDWDQARLKLGDAVSQPGTDPLGIQVDKANHEIELLINYTAGDGFSYRQRARAAVDEDWRLNMLALTAALLFSILVAWLLARHIIRRVGAASDVAGRIAMGQLDGPMPQGGEDELGALLQSLSIMRDNLRSMMQREVAQRQSAQGRLLDAMESSHEGIVVVGRDANVILANDQALAMLGWHDQAAAPAIGLQWSQIAAHLPMNDGRGEVAMPGGQWFNVSRSPTREGGFVVVISDITAIKDQGARLERTNLRLDTALANMSQGLCLFDAEGRLSVVNARYSELFRLPPGSVRLGLTLLEMIALRVEHGNHAGMTVEHLAMEKMAAMERRQPASFSLSLTDSRILNVVLRPAPKGSWAITYEDATERRLAEERVVFMARHDVLTRLPNRTLFAERMQQVLASPRHGSGLAVLCLDLDRFKVVNDTLGHAMGDLLLQMVAERLQACIRAEDMASRIGGDEFTIIQVGPPSSEATSALARRLVEVVGEPYDLDGRRAIIGVSIGIAVAPATGSSADVLLRNADMALYRAKAEGRGMWRFYHPEMDTAIRARRALGAALREALANNEFELRYQPIYDLRRERVRGFEALLRWSHPELGNIPPAEFIPIAEELGLMVSIGHWVVRQACAEAAGWPAHLSVSVNVSPAQFGAGCLQQTVAEALQAAALAGSRLTLEVTETVLMSKNSINLSSLQALRAMGVHISLDDFGTGYSSLSYLASFPLDQIKIDQSFTQSLAAESTQLIVQAIIGLANKLSLRVVAEGVETAEQVQWMRDAGCDDVQGYRIARPMEASALRNHFETTLTCIPAG